MKLFFFFSLFFSFNLNAEVGRSPAVVGGVCDLDIETTKIEKGTEKLFNSVITHQVIVRSGDESGCWTLPEKRYPDSVYKENVHNEMKILFQKYADNYSQKCNKYFKDLGLKNSEFACDTPEIDSVSFAEYRCEKQFETGTRKLSFAASAKALIKYKQIGKKIEEKSVEVVQKEQCARVNECIEQASEKDISELKKLAVVACKNELTPIASGRAPAIEKDSSFDGNRVLKSSGQKLDTTTAHEDPVTIGK